MQKKFSTIKKFLLDNADAIQKLATKHHKRFLGGMTFRSELLSKYQKNHVKVVYKFADNLEVKDLKRGTASFKKLGEILAKDSVKDGLTIEEAVDGIIFLKQAVWELLDKEGLLDELTARDFYQLSQTIGTYCDVTASKIAFTYNQDHTKQLTDSLNRYKQIEKNLQFLTESSKVLASSLDYQTTLHNIAKLAVPEIADWCAVDILDGKGELQQIAITHKDPKKVKWAKELRKLDPPDLNASTGVPNVIRTAKSELYPQITDELLVKVAKNKKQLKLMRDIGFTSAMVVPLCREKKCIGAITFITTETKRYYDEKDLAMAEELANRASVALENAGLYKASQEAVALRDDFISVASHELKTPVTSVKMFTQVLKKHSEQIGDEKAVDHLSKMDKQLNKLTELIYDLLNVSKIQAGKMDFKEELFDFDKAVKEVVDVLQQTSSKHKIVIEGVTRKKVRGDEERVGQVLNNLISNAIKYSPKADKVLVKLSSDKGNVYAAVQDFGIGMGKIHLDRIFERFYRVYDTTDKTFPGLGIGLYISSEIIKRHGGKLWVDSDVGKGSIFHFSIPLNGKKTLKKGA